MRAKIACHAKVKAQGTVPATLAATRRRADGFLAR